MSVCKTDYLSDFIGLFNFEWHRQKQLTILPFLCCGEIVKNSKGVAKVREDSVNSFDPQEFFIVNFIQICQFCT